MPDRSRTPVHTFGRPYGGPAHEQDFENCISWPYCGCMRRCASFDPAPAKPSRFWLAFAFSCVVPLAYAAFLFFNFVWSAP